MNTLPQVSVVMPTFEQSHFIRRALEGPFICLEKGTWPQMVELFQHADGRIFTSPEMRDWFDTVIPGLSAARPCHVLGIGVFYDGVDELGPMLRRREHMQALRARVWAARPQFTFDHHVPALVDFFRTVMANRSPAQSRSAA